MTEQIARRCEEAEGPTFALDLEIEKYVWETKRGMVKPRGFASFPYTSSIDRAATLVPEGWAFFLDSNTPIATVYLPCLSHTKQTKAHGSGKTPALALCAAALRAGGDNG